MDNEESTLDQVKELITDRLSALSWESEKLQKRQTEIVNERHNLNAAIKALLQLEGN